MFVLKLILVPSALGLVSAAGKRWGPSVAGWLAGFPIVTGPILLLLAIEKGSTFAAQGAIASLSAVFASISFSLTYAWVCLRHGWTLSLLAGVSAWSMAAWLLTLLPSSVYVSLGVALSTLMLTPFAFPSRCKTTGTNALQLRELLCRMLAGALLTIAVTSLSSTIGPSWSGLLAVFPILGIVLAVSSHRGNGSMFAISLLSAMASSLCSFVAFCFSLAIILPRHGTPIAFVGATLFATISQIAARTYIVARVNNQTVARNRASRS